MKMNFASIVVDFFEKGLPGSDGLVESKCVEESWLVNSLKFMFQKFRNWRGTCWFIKKNILETPETFISQGFVRERVITCIMRLEEFQYSDYSWFTRYFGSCRPNYAAFFQWPNFILIVTLPSSPIPQINKLRQDKGNFTQNF